MERGWESREERLVAESTREEREVGLCTYRCGAARRLLGPHAALDALRGVEMTVRCEEGGEEGKERD